MSTATTKRTLQTADADALAFRAHWPANAWESWTVAGSVRRRKHEVGDIEHVIIPRLGPAPGAPPNLFSEPAPTVNLLWHHLDRLVAEYALARHIYPNSARRWGDRYRGIDYRGCNHEIFLADRDNLGAILAIRTGPADYSRYLVTRLRHQGYLQHAGYVRDLRPYDGRQPADPAAQPIVPVPTEECYFQLCDLPWTEPQHRRAP